MLLDRGRSAAEVSAEREDMFRRLMMVRVRVCVCVCVCVCACRSRVR